MTRPLNDQDLLHLTPEQAQEIYAQGPEAVVWALLKLSILASEQAASGATGDAPTPAAVTAPPLSTPSAQVPPYHKPSGDGGTKSPGRKAGHPGTRRPKPLVIDRHVEHSLACCPQCGGKVSDSYDVRKRIVEDLEASRAVTTEHALHVHYCPHCKTRVEAKVGDALPKSTIGNRALALSSWLHYGLGNTTSQVVDVLNSVFHFKVTGGGLCQQWQRLAELLRPWYDAIGDEARSGAVLHADETGWRVNGKTHWLWCFTSPGLTHYVIDATRSADVLREFLKDGFDGTLVSDFYGAYNAVETIDRQLCLAHLLRELKETGRSNTSAEYAAFHARLKRLLQDAIELGRRTDRESDDFQQRRQRLRKRLDALCESAHEDADCKRLVKRLVKYREGLLTFLAQANVPADNNRAEREIRPAVIARKNSFHNASERGADAQAILMSVYRTLKQRGHDLVQTVYDALKVAIETGTLPPLPPQHIASEDTPSP